jgi:hypothetical protein
MGEERVAEGGEVDGEFLWEGWFLLGGGGAQVEHELEARLVGGGEEFKLVRYFVGIAEPGAGGLIE